MKKLILLAMCLGFSAITFAQSTIKLADAGVTYGKTVTADNAVSTEALNTTLSSGSVYNGKITGTVIEVCKKKGCFMKLQQANGPPIMVQFTDYAYFMPQNIVGKTVVVEGKAKVKETSVERLKHYAADAGKTKEEIAMINSPKKDISIMADGVLVVK
ncbi:MULTISPECIES: DUF4920 domain-containing protein [unclassified Mucilaginibacter]|uniref:DUF4920 domain-containing protein n=1 Tax=unclassified Mucilaginibacter TaxID=2617802 RepID=UPI002AC90205|nr:MULTISPECIES: DUF4920 domain-containing protein [unclassified Mucilaginibacter]MEB0260250.1 DUF4920 domain-containing protein [Mucilaginibacter sp. 10I4]MEB0277339.1 DUF4920 domain-containing protein [Mucilaginibacter sp. 10B2]MEB0300179.1 DUF4920 domain-containing protein [Mucilaginibacter sp. 5C4]WPX25464.1 DUF4920 domain-containing protein [Mucilaginibacter sp. 5C4]